jgi:hypothetical protein
MAALIPAGTTHHRHLSGPTLKSPCALARPMPTPARGAAYALLTVGLVNIAAGLFLYSRIDALFLANNVQGHAEANSAIVVAVQLGAGLLAAIGFIALTVGIVMFTIGPSEKPAPKKDVPPTERIG